MSLDVYLTGGGSSPAGSGIFVRENGQTREIDRVEWNKRFPGTEPLTFEGLDDDTTYSANITHNLGKMADAAGIYKHLWRPDEIGITRAAELIEPLTEGLERLKSDPDMFRKLNPENGWGSYEGLLAFVSDYLAACKANPGCEVSVWR